MINLTVLIHTSVSIVYIRSSMTRDMRDAMLVIATRIDQDDA